MRAPLLLAALLAAGCGAPARGPDLAGPLAIRELGRMKDLAERGDWAALAASEPPACGGPRDAVCAERHALRARGCARLAEAAPGTERRAHLDCAVASGRAALAAAEATGAAERTAWREALAGALFDRRQARPPAEACQDNALLLAEAEVLRAGQPAAPRPRFLVASARLTAAARDCAPGATPATRCAELAAARGLLRDPPPEAAAPWQALRLGLDLTARRLACPT